MKRFFVLVIAVSLGMVVAKSQTINDANAEVRTVEPFHGIEVSTGIKLKLIVGTTQAVAVSASEPEFRDKITTKVVNGILKIHYDSEFGSINKDRAKKQLRAYVSYTTLDVLNANTGAQIEIQGVLKVPSLSMDAHTGAEIEGNLEVADMTVDQGTGSKIELTGQVDKLVVEGDTGSKFEGMDLSANSCSATTSTGARIEITVNKELNVKASTGGDVRYKGAADIREIKTNSGGSVTKI